MNETMSREVMVLNVINKINQKLMFIYHKNNFLTPGLERLLCNSLALIMTVLPGTQI